MNNKRLYVSVVASLLSVAAAHSVAAQEHPEGLSHKRTSPAVVERLLKDVAGDEPTRYQATKELGALKREAAKRREDVAEEIDRMLLGLLRDMSVRVMGSAAEELASSRPRSEQAIPILMEIVKNSANDPPRRMTAIRGLKQFGSEAIAARGMLKSLLADRANPEPVRCYAGMALAFICSADREVADALGELLLDVSEVEEIRYTAATALGKMKGRAAKYLHQAAQGMNKDQVAFRLVVIKALGEDATAVDGSLQLLEEIAADPEETGLVRKVAIDGIGSAGAAAAKAVPALIALIKSELPESGITSAAVVALGKIGPRSARRAAGAGIIARGRGYPSLER